MYIDIVPNRKSPPAVLLRKDHREGGRTIKRTLANLSALPPEAIAALRAVIKGQRLVGASDYFVVEKSLPCGHVHAVRGRMQRLAMTELIASKPCRERDLVLAMIAQRVLRPDSKLGTAARFNDTTLAGDFGVQDANTCRVGDGKHAAQFQRPTEATPHQREAFRLLQIPRP